MQGALSLSKNGKVQPVTSGSFHEEIFKACGKLPASPDLASLERLLASTSFSGNAADYVDFQGSSLLMYAAGPIGLDTMPVIKALMDHGCHPAYKNHNGNSAVAFVKMWKGSSGQEQKAADYDHLIDFLVEHGADRNERAVGSNGR